MAGERMNGRIIRLLKNRQHVEANIALSLELLEATDRARALAPAAFATAGHASRFAGVGADPSQPPHWVVDAGYTKADAVGAAITCRFSAHHLEALFHLWRTMVPAFGATASLREEVLSSLLLPLPFFEAWSFPLYSCLFASPSGW